MGAGALAPAYLPVLLAFLLAFRACLAPLPHSLVDQDHTVVRGAADLAPRTQPCATVRNRAQPVRNLESDP